MVAASVMVGVQGGYGLLGMGLQFHKMKTVMEVDGGDGCTT